MSAEQNSTQCAANELGVVLRLGGIGIRKLTNLSVGPAGRYVPLASQSSRALPLPVRRKGGRPALPLAARRRNAEHLGRQVITSAEEGWRKYPGDGPDQTVRRGKDVHFCNGFATQAAAERLVIRGTLGRGTRPSFWTFLDSIGVMRRPWARDPLEHVPQSHARATGAGCGAPR